jgi:hypothetical protein
MIQITLKARHFYYIAANLKNYSVGQYLPLINRMKKVLSGNTDFEAEFSVEATVSEVIDIYKMLTFLPEGQSNTFNTEMSQLLQPQIIAGATQEGINGIGPDADGNLPDNAYWQLISQGITYTRNNNISIRNSSILVGQSIIDSI